jgi:hypothetical protein
LQLYQKLAKQSWKNACTRSLLQPHQAQTNSCYLVDSSVEKVSLCRSCYSLYRKSDIFHKNIEHINNSHCLHLIIIAFKTFIPWFLFLDRNFVSIEIKIRFFFLKNSHFQKFLFFFLLLHNIIFILKNSYFFPWVP